MLSWGFYPKRLTVTVYTGISYSPWNMVGLGALAQGHFRHGWRYRERWGWESNLQPFEPFKSTSLITKPYVAAPHMKWPYLYIIFFLDDTGLPQSRPPSSSCSAGLWWGAGTYPEGLSLVGRNWLNWVLTLGVTTRERRYFGSLLSMILNPRSGSQPNWGRQRRLIKDGENNR